MPTPEVLFIWDDVPSASEFLLLRKIGSSYQPVSMVPIRRTSFEVEILAGKSHNFDQAPGPMLLSEMVTVRSSVVESQSNVTLLRTNFKKV